MAPAQPQRTPRPEVHFAPNTPVTVALKFAQGKIVSGMSGERVMYSTVDNRVMFLDLEVASQIEALGINVREPFTITMNWDGQKTSPRAWTVARIAQPVAAGEQRDGTFAVPKLAEAAAVAGLSGAAVTPKPPAIASAAVPSDARARGAEILVAESIVLVDAYAAVLKHALETHAGRVKPDEVKSIFLTAVINLAGGKSRAA